MQNIRSTAAYFKIDLSRFSDGEIERIARMRFNSLKELSTCCNIVSNVYLKAQLALASLQKGAQT